MALYKDVQSRSLIGTLGNWYAFKQGGTSASHWRLSHSGGILLHILSKQYPYTGSQLLTPGFLNSGLRSTPMEFDLALIVIARGGCDTILKVKRFFVLFLGLSYRETI